MPHQSHKATFADDNTLLNYGCRRLPNVEIENDINSSLHENEMSNFRHSSGWCFRSYHDTILGEEELRQFYRSSQSIIAANYSSAPRNLDTTSASSSECSKDSRHFVGYEELHINDKCILRFPPMSFVKDVMHMVPPSSTADRSMCGIAISARDALLSWASKHTEEENIARGGEIQPIRVSYAKKWCEARQDIISELSTSGKASRSEIFPDHESIRNNSDHNNSTISEIKLSGRESIHHHQRGIYDWTYSSDYCCTLIDTSEKEERSHSKVFILRAPFLKEFPQHSLSYNYSLINGPNETYESIHWEENKKSPSVSISELSSSGIDYDLLKNQAEPILFYDEFILYQDDLEDSGEVSMEAKLRVMPSCWYALQKHFIRIDGVVVMCRETRLFHKFNKDRHELSSNCVVFMDITWRQISLGFGQDSDALKIVSSSNVVASTTKPSEVVPPIAAAVASTGSLPGSLSHQLMSPHGKTLTHLIPVVLISNREDWREPSKGPCGTPKHYIIHFL